MKCCRVLVGLVAATIAVVANAQAAPTARSARRAAPKAHLCVILVRETDAGGPLTAERLVQLRAQWTHFDADLPPAPVDDPYELHLSRDFFEGLRSVTTYSTPDPAQRYVAILAFRWTGTSPPQIRSFGRTSPPPVPPPPTWSFIVRVPLRWDTRDTAVALEPTSGVIWHFTPVQSQSFAFIAAMPE